MRRSLILAALALFAGLSLRATTLPPELKAYDFAEAYYVEDGGVVISPYAQGLFCPDGTPTPEGIRVMPGQYFLQFNEGHHLEQEFRLVRLDAEGRRAFFHERVFRYNMVRNSPGRLRPQRGLLLSTDDFYLSRFRGMEPFDHVFTNIELHPGAREWSVSKN